MRKLRTYYSFASPLLLTCAVFISIEYCFMDEMPVSVPSTIYRIDNKTEIKNIFKCSSIHFIGSYNEYYVACKFTVPAQENLTLLEIVNVKLDSSALSPLFGVHAELIFQLNMNLTSVSIRNSQLQASAVDIYAAYLSIDEQSSINVSARGLKFGPGYNSWTAMGGSYGGIGGASLSSTYQICDDVPPNDFFRAVGDVSANIADFRGYGSGGGNSESRGGGRIRLETENNVELNGLLLANGGNACLNCYDSAGAGGTIVVVAKRRIFGNSTVQANGGDPSRFDMEKYSGGGGGGGGGRIFFDSMDAEELAPDRVEAFGGGISFDKNASIEWCQLGGDGTIFKLQHSLKSNEELVDSESRIQRLDGNDTSVSTLLIKGARLANVGPIKRIQLFGCTPIFQQTSRGALFLPESLVHLLVSGGATVCASVIQLKESVGGMNSSIVLDSGSKFTILRREQMIRLVASQIMLQGSVGPSPPHKRILHAQVNIRTESSTIIDGFIYPLNTLLDHTRNLGTGETPLISVTSLRDVELRPQAVELGKVELRINAAGLGLLDMPFDSPLLKLSISAANVSIINVNSGPVLECRAIQLQANASACRILRESAHHDYLYSINVFAFEEAKLGNISAGSMILCSDDKMTIEGAISSSYLGCGSGIGPGKSFVFGEASGGAGHGGRGGNVLPGGSGGGATYDIPKDSSLQSVASRINILSDEQHWPIWPGSGAANGDSSGKVSGGSGGGIIYIGSKMLNLTKSAIISARGGAGFKGGGGGSGGSLSLFIADIAGGGAIALEGGASSTSQSSVNSEIRMRSLVWNPILLPTEIDEDEGKVGGGGGGGIISITYVDTTNDTTAGNGEKFIQDGGHISVDGGVSTGGENGGPGVMAGYNCLPGRGGVFCLPCPGGTHSPGRFSKCFPCEPGTCSSHAGAVKCDTCSVGHFNPEFGKKDCQKCPLGSFGAKLGLKKCELCPPGTFAGSTGSTSCSFCPIGSITTGSGRSNCTLCGIGETTATIGATVCGSCTKKPVHSEFNMRGNCSYACYKGRNGLDCLTPFERFVNPIGGPVGFVVLVLCMTSLIFGAWGFLSHRSSESELRRYARYRSQRMRDESSLKTLTRKLTPRLTDQDFQSHVARLYFAGNNHLKSAWQLNPYFLPKNLCDIVQESTYANFAATCNKLVEWNPSNWEGWLYHFLLATVPPLSTLFMRRRQLHRVMKLSQYTMQYGGRFFRDVNFRVHGTQLKVGFSPDFSLCYFDVLILKSSSSLSLNLVKFQSVNFEDQVLVVGGSGSFFRPYHLDTNDIVVRAIPSRLELLEHNFWIDFVADLNEKLRVLPQPSSALRRVREAINVSRDIFMFLKEFNAKHVKHDFSVTFGIFSADFMVGADGNSSCFKPIALENVDETFASFPHEPFKLAFRVSRLNLRVMPQPMKYDSSTSDPHFLQLRSEKNDYAKAVTDPRSTDFRYSRIRMEALSAHPTRNSLENITDDSSDDNDSLIPRRKAQNTCKVQQSRALLSLLMLTSGTVRKLLIGLWSPIYPLFRLRNLPRSKLPIRWSFPVVMVVLLIADMGAVFYILVEYYCVQVRDPTTEESGCSRTALWSFLGILPAAAAGSPILGLIFITRKSVFFGKLFTLWNASSVVNQVIAFVCGLAYLAYIHDDILLVAVGGVIIKYLEKEVAVRCIAEYASRRTFRGWRGLHTTRDWYDAAYTPLVHYER
ncbi:Insulin-like growth factor binding protein, N-terminal [Plasmopara halstedii]|uniref:Insulin-like growth factor binding protein, N-terminal n=1 Tax=Plasmopara halstedii TaxID=4781 RepID=A0A0P1AZZ1_PLAHL|nr:Insulin-like growth factor binding protein, N-terminal [Plasmopara halstedii]CEG48012.1 Insulin-like growth factor binding protein, N-terminal [Plasmopara halstedii]|eukprot:XP_024584381.1 Insulin-like growth factor binding protein, N-terminal [Plasmopara halstedii]